MVDCNKRVDLYSGIVNRLDTRSFDLREDGSLPSTAVTKYRRKGIGNAKGIVDLLTYDLGER